jgi:hypothetical protein
MPFPKAYLKLFLVLVFLGGINRDAYSLKGNPGFIENRGQIVDQNGYPNKQVLFVSSAGSFNIQLRKNGYSYEFFSSQNIPAIPPGKKSFPDPSVLKDIRINVSRIDIDFENMDLKTEVQAFDESGVQLNYFKNGESFTGIRTFKKVVYKNVYPNTDIEFISSPDPNRPLKYNIILHPGADPKNIRLLIRGGEARLNQGNLEIGCASGKITEKIPLSYYTDQPGINQPVNFSLEKNLLSFNCSYDQNKTLVIDPTSNIIWGTYYGGSNMEYCSAVKTDQQNNIYITGHTTSASNIATAGTYQSTIAGDFDIYLAKFNSAGQLIWGTYFGGSIYETAYCLCLDASGNIYVGGDSGSGTNVASPGAHQTVYGGGIDDAVIVKFDPNGQRLWSTYYGGTLHDIIYCMNIDNAGNIIVGGHTESTNGTGIIATIGAYQTSFTYAYDVFVAKFTAAGTRVWGTYYGDTGFEEAWGIVADVAGNVYITGFSSSVSGIATAGSHQQFSGGNNDAYLAKFDPTGSTVLWATYYGGASDDAGAAVEIDAQGKIFMGGNTGSSASISTPGSYQTTPGSPDDVFLTCFNSTGVRQWGTYYGGNGTDYLSDILVDANQNIMFSGETLSTNSISTVGAYQPSIGLVNTYDAYFTRFKNSGSIDLATYFGSSGNDNGRGIALDNTGLLYMCGETTSTVGIASPGAYMSNAGGNGDGMLIKFCLAPQPSITPVTTPTLCLNDTYTMTATNGFPNYFWSNGSVGNPLMLNGGLSPGTFYYHVTVTDAYGCNGVSDSVKVIINNCVTGINEINIQAGFKIYPVPAQNELFIECDENHESFYAEIFSLTGELMLAEKVAQKKSMDVSRLAPGAYFIRVNGALQKFVKL